MSEPSLLGVISDTHGRLDATLRAIRLFRHRGVSKIIHCGDIGGTAVVRAFEGTETHFVFGNTDADYESLRRAAQETGNVLHGWFGSIEWLDKRIGFLHGHRNNRFEQELDEGGWDLICFGHTHEPVFQIYKETLLLNPGALHRVKTPRVALVALPELAVESLTLDEVDG